MRATKTSLLQELQVITLPYPRIRHWDAVDPNGEAHTKLGRGFADVVDPNGRCSRSQWECVTVPRGGRT